jgi:prepilin-type N-terminal cleavage/methylation domain-containing protein
VPCACGFTLAESLVASVVLALAVVGVSGALVASQRQTDMQEDSAVAVSLARELIERVAAKPLELSDGTTGLAGWPGVTNASLYDTAGDFDGYHDVVTSPVWRNRNVSVSFTTAAPPAAQSGQPQYARTVSVTYPTSLFGTAINAGDVAIVKISVQGPSGGAVTLSRVVSKAAITR